MGVVFVVVMVVVGVFVVFVVFVVVVITNIRNCVHLFFSRRLPTQVIASQTLPSEIHLSRNFFVKYTSEIHLRATASLIRYENTQR